VLVVIYDLYLCNQLCDLSHKVYVIGGRGLGEEGEGLKERMIHR